MSVVQTDQHACAVDLDFMARSIFGGWHAHGVSISNIEFRTMPRAHDAEVLEFAVAQGPTIVGAEIFDGIHIATDGHHDDEAIIDFKRPGDIWEEFRKFTNVLERGSVEHGFCF
jgi:hypothetical protein